MGEQSYGCSPIEPWRQMGWTAPALYPQERTSALIVQETEWAPGLVRTGMEGWEFFYSPGFESRTSQPVVSSSAEPCPEFRPL